jgi:hypothetical protein
VGASSRKSCQANGGASSARRRRQGSNQAELAAKLTAIVVGLAVIGGLLLGLRQQRLAMGHRLVGVYARLDESRRALWDYQVELARHTQPQRLRRAIEEAGLELVHTAPRAAQGPAQRWEAQQVRPARRSQEAGENRQAWRIPR